MPKDLVHFSKKSPQLIPVDGSEILNNHLGWLKSYYNNGIIIILGGAGFQPSTVQTLSAPHLWGFQVANPFAPWMVVSVTTSGSRSGPNNKHVNLGQPH